MWKKNESVPEPRGSGERKLGGFPHPETSCHAYSPSDSAEFTRREPVHGDGATEPAAKYRRVVDQAKAKLRMKEILHHAFLVFELAKVTYPSLNQASVQTGTSFPGRLEPIMLRPSLNPYKKGI